MPNQNITMRQLMALLFTGLLSPAVRVLPGATAALGGRAGWLSTLLALPLALGLCWVLSALFRRLPPGTGLGEACLLVLGKWPGRILLTIYLLWGLFLLAANTRLCGLRFLSTGYRNGPGGLFLAVLLGLTLWLALRPVRVLARAGEVFRLAVGLGLAFSLVLGAFQVEARHVLPVWTGDLPGLFSAAVPVLGLLGCGVYAAFLGGNVTRAAGDRRRLLRWGVMFCLVLTALQLVCQGSFGPGLTARADTPFFLMVKGIGIEGTFQRVESVIIALWVFSDLALLSLLAASCCALAQAVFRLRERRHAAVPVVLAALAAAWGLFPDAFTLARWMDRAVWPGSLLLGFGLPALLLLVKKLRRLE